MASSKVFEEKLNGGVNKMLEVQVKKLTGCMESNQNDMEGFVKCFTPFNKKFQSTNEELSQKMNFVMYTMSKCMEKNGESNQQVCVEQACSKIDTAMSGTVKELDWF